VTRTALVAVAAALLGGAGVLFVQGQTAQAQEVPRVMCTQIPQNPGSLDEQYVAKFMGEQLALGRVRFTSLSGVSTVMCAF
jgi:hypothetical protein